MQEALSKAHVPSSYLVNPVKQPSDLHLNEPSAAIIQALHAFKLQETQPNSPLKI